MAHNPPILPQILQSSSLDHLLEGIQPDFVIMRAPTDHSKMNIWEPYLCQFLQLVYFTFCLNNLLWIILSFSKIYFCKYLHAIFILEEGAILSLDSPSLCSGQLKSWLAIFPHIIPLVVYYSCQWSVISWDFNQHFFLWLLSYFSDVLGRFMIGSLSGCIPGQSWNYRMLLWCFDSIKNTCCRSILLIQSYF